MSEEDKARATAAIVISQHVRNRLEPLHAVGAPGVALTQDQMMRINIAVRFAVYEALTWLGDEPQLVAVTLAMFPGYAERPGSPELQAAYEQLVRTLE